MGDIRLMIYKVGDKVKIKDRADMEVIDGRIALTYDVSGGCCSFTKLMEKSLKSLGCDRVLTIKSIYAADKQYTMEEIEYYWTDKMIECLAEKYEESDPVDNRWEILDL